MSSHRYPWLEILSIQMKDKAHCVVVQLDRKESGQTDAPPGYPSQSDMSSGKDHESAFKSSAVPPLGSLSRNQAHQDHQKSSMGQPRRTGHQAKAINPSHDPGGLPEAMDISEDGPSGEQKPMQVWKKILSKGEGAPDLENIFHGTQESPQALKQLHDFAMDPKYRMVIAQEMQKGTFPTSILLLIPRTVLVRIAYYLIKQGHLELLRTCKALARRLQPLVYQYGRLRLVLNSMGAATSRNTIGQDRPCNAKPERIQYLEITIVRDQPLPSPPQLDPNVQILAYFSGDAIVRRLCSITLVGTIGQSALLSRDELLSFRGLNGFSTLVFNINCISPHTALPDWKSKHYNATLNDLVNTAEQLTQVLGPFHIETKGAVFHPHGWYNKATVSALSTQVNFPRRNPEFWWTPELMRPGGRVLVRPAYQMNYAPRDQWVAQHQKAGTQPQMTGMQPRGFQYGVGHAPQDPAPRYDVPHTTCAGYVTQELVPPPSLVGPKSAPVQPVAYRPVPNAPARAGNRAPLTQSALEGVFDSKTKKVASTANVPPLGHKVDESDGVLRKTKKREASGGGERGKITAAAALPKSKKAKN